MTTTVDDIDELEALLAGLDEDELNASLAASLANDDDGIELPDDEPEPEVVKPAPKAPRTRKLKPLVTEETPVEPVAVVEPVAPVTAVAEAGDNEDLASLEELATKVIDLMTLIGTERPDLTEDDIQAAATPVLERIKSTSSYAKVEAAIRKRIDAIAKPEPVADTATDAELEELVMDDEPEPTPEPVKTPEPVLEAVVEPVPEPEMASDDAELEALLSAAPEVVAPVVIPAPTALTGAAAAVATRPTKTKAGALRTFIDANQLQEDLAFTTTNISMAMTRQAALFAHYSRLAADAVYQSDRSKQQVELLEATLNQRFRDSLIASGTKFTEKSIDSMVIQDSSYQEAQERAHEARAIAKMVDTAADSFRHRKDMLIQVGADLRMEKQGELRMKEHPGEAAKRAMGGE